MAQLVAAGEYSDRWFVNAAMRCERPVQYHWIARASFRGGSGATAPERGGAARVAGGTERQLGARLCGPSPLRPMCLEILFRCRACKECERANSRQWAARACLEYERSVHTWFGTLTLSPAHHALVDSWASSAGLWPDKSRLSEAQFEKALFRARAAVIGKEIDSWLSMVREIAYLRTHKRELIRYLLVAERHDSHATSEIMRNRPHYHMLLHEGASGAAFSGDILRAYQGEDNLEVVRRMKKRGNEWVPAVFAADEAIARKAWVLGHSKFEHCINAKAAFYVCKYMYQSDMARVRASVHYGRRDESPALQAAQAANLVPSLVEQERN